MNPKLKEIYAELPQVMCKGLCHDSCGVIPVSPIERATIAEFTGRRVKVDPDLVIGLHSDHRVLRPKHSNDLTCPYLQQKRCSIHAARPVICRMYGVVNGMPCPHGCVTSAPPLSDERAMAIVEKIAKLK